MRRQVSVLLAAAALLAASCEDSRPKGGAITIARVVVTNISEVGTCALPGNQALWGDADHWDPTWKSTAIVGGTATFPVNTVAPLDLSTLAMKPVANGTWSVVGGNKLGLEGRENLSLGTNGCICPNGGVYDLVVDARQPKARALTFVRR